LQDALASCREMTRSSWWSGAAGVKL